MCATPDETEIFLTSVEKALDKATQTLELPKDDPRRCYACGRIRPDICSLCSDEIRAIQDINYQHHRNEEY